MVFFSSRKTDVNDLRSVADNISEEKGERLKNAVWLEMLDALKMDVPEYGELASAWSVEESHGRRDIFGFFLLTHTCGGLHLVVVQSCIRWLQKGGTA